MYGGDSFIIMKDKKAISIKDSFFNSNSSFQHGTIFILFYGICKCACYTYLVCLMAISIFIYFIFSLYYNQRM